MTGSRTLLVLPALLLFVMTGCSQGNGDTLTKDSFLNLLKVEDIQADTGEVGLETQLRDLKQLAAQVDEQQVSKMDAGYLMSFGSAEGPFKSVTLSVIDFDSRTSAQDHFDKVRSETPGLEEMSPSIGDSSVRVQINDKGLGSVLVLMKGDKFVSLHTTIVDGEPPMVGIAGLERLAAIVDQRLK